MPLRVGLIGYPLGHSLSPVFQQAAFDTLGIDARYDLWPTPAAAVPTLVAGLRAVGTLGANVTVPHKELVVRLADKATAGVRRLGAANTLVRRPDGTLLADNTDVYGFQRSLDEAKLVVAGEKVIVLGAGGAARAVLVALADAGARQIVVANRTVDRANALVRELDLAATAQACPLDSAHLAPHLAGVRLIVNATAIGWHGDETPLAPALLPSGAAVYDLTYRSTALLRAAAQRGLVALDGLRMLVYQGARAFELWTGREAPVAVMLVAAERALAERQAREATARS